MKSFYLVAPLIICAANIAPDIARAQSSTESSTPQPTTTETTSTETSSATPGATPEATPTETPDETVIIVTAARNTRTLAQTTSAVTVVTRAQIEAKKPLDLVEAIRLAPGVAVAQSGTFGKTTSIFLRGTNSNQTLVLLDGVRANSPADGRFDFGTIPVENIERIEIVRGPQSALYGSDALGGVINIITRRGNGEFKSGGRIEFGSQNTNKQVVTARGGNAKGDGISFSLTRLSSNGFFANDDYKNLGASLRLDKALSTDANLAFTLRADDAKVGTPGQRDFSFDPNARSFPRDLSGSLQFTNKSGKRRDRIVLGAFDRRLRFEDALNPGDLFSTFTNSLNRNRVLDVDAQSSFERGAHTFTIGGELRRENASVQSVSTFGNTSFSRATNTQALFVQDEFRNGKFNLVSGLRYERNSQFGGNLSGRLSGSYRLNERAKLKASVGTGFKAPSFNDLYYPNYGNPNLQPEKSVGGDLGIEYSISRGGSLEVTAFTNRLRNLITGVFVPPMTFQAANIGRAATQGIEIGLRQPLSEDLTFSLNQTFLNTSSQTPLLRRPKFNTTADLIYKRDKLNFDFGIVAQGRRFDLSPSYATQNYGGAARFDLTLGYEIRPQTQLYVRAQNLFNRRYDEAAGFPSPRFNFVIGLQTGAF